LPSQRCDPAQTLQKIQRDPFRFQDRSGQSADLDDRFAALDLDTIASDNLGVN
jgi:hypothetical protein